MRATVALSPAILLALILGPVSASAQEVGTAGAVNPASTGTPPSRPTRTLELGSKVIHRERISTAPGGNVQLIFLDKTTMSIGPNSDVVIDEFVYDPNAGTGRMAASMAKGVLRFVGGNTSHSGGADIKTPSATLGIRGGVATIEVRACGPAGGQGCGTKVISHYGTLSITTAAGTEIIRRPGFAVTIAAPGASPSAPRRVTQAEVTQTNQSVSSQPGQNGGKPRITEAAIARADTLGPGLTRVGTAIASQQAQNLGRNQRGSQVLGLSVAPLDATSPTQIQNVTTDLRQQVTAQEQQVTTAQDRQVAAQTTLAPTSPSQTAAASGNSDRPVITPPPVIEPPAVVTPPVIEPLPVPVPAAGGAFALAQSGRPAFLAPFASLISYVSPVLGYNPGGTTSQNGTRSASVLQAGLGINGSGAGQTSALFVSVGESSVNIAGGNQFAGGATATARSSATALPVRSNSGLVGSGASNVQLDANGAPTSLSLLPGSISANGTITSETAAGVSYPGRQQSNYTFTDVQSRIPTPDGLGVNRPNYNTIPNTNFGGVVGGLVTTVNNTAGTALSTTPLTGLFDIAFAPATSRFGTTIYVNTSNSDSNALQYAFLSYGYQGAGTSSDRGSYIDYNNFGAREARNTDANRTYPTSVNGTQVAEHRGAFVTSNTVNAQALFPNVTFCQCEFTRWGFWSSDTNRTANGNNLSDLVHLGTWAYGPVAEIGQIPTSGIATYDGHAVASIKSGSAEYVAAGNFQNAVNFGTRSGVATVTNLDGRSYSGAVTIANGYNNIAGQLVTTGSAPATLALSGQFSRGTVGPAGEMLGTVTINGSNYIGSGIFAGATKAISP